jgi:hypothetical protein
MHAQGLAEAILRFLKATWFDAVMPLATVAAAFFAWKSWQVGDKSFRLQKAKADKQPNIVVSMAPQAWVDHGPAMKLGNYGNYQTGGKYPLRIYINNTGTLQADNYRISLYLPKGIGFDPIDRPYGNLPSMKPGTTVVLDNEPYQEIYFEDKSLPVTAHPIDVAQVSLTARPVTKGVIRWNVSCADGYQFRGQIKTELS